MDQWEFSDKQVVHRIHRQPRQELFTPLHVSGGPSVKTLAGARVTVGRFTDTGERFKRIDSWKSRGSAHELIERPWQGVTTLFIKGQEEYSHDGLNEAQPDVYINGDYHFEKFINGATQDRQAPRSAVVGSGNIGIPYPLNSIARSNNRPVATV